MHCMSRPQDLSMAAARFQVRHFIQQFFRALHNIENNFSLQVVDQPQHRQKL